MIDTQKHIERMNLVIAETEKDVHEMEGKPFNGKVVAEYHGYTSAGMTAIAETLKAVLEELQSIENATMIN